MYDVVREDINCTPEDYRSPKFIEHGKTCLCMDNPASTDYGLQSLCFPEYFYDRFNFPAFARLKRRHNGRDFICCRKPGAHYLQAAFKHCVTEKTSQQEMS